MTPLAASFRAELIRVAARFCAPRASIKPHAMPLDHIRVEPHPDGGAMIVAANGADMIVARDPTATLSRPATIRLDTRMIKTADDLRKTSGAALVIRNASVYLDGLQSRFDETDAPFLDWRRLICYIETAQIAPASNVLLSAATLFRAQFVAAALERAAGATSEEADAAEAAIEPGPGAITLIKFPTAPHVFVIAYQDDETAPIARAKAITRDAA